MRTSISLAISVVVFVASTPVVSAQRRPQARPCRPDSFYVEVPLRLESPWHSTAFTGLVNNDLRPLAIAPGLPGFCGYDQVTCPSGQVAVDISSVLPQRASPYRSDGDYRFLRVKFRDAQSRLLSVRPSAQCEVVQKIRERFAARAPAPDDQFYVGRECDASAMGVEDVASAEMLSWHVERMGLPASAIDIAEPRLDVQTVDLALIDSGVIAEVGTAPGGIGLASESDFSGDLGLHAHGTGMAILTRPIGPDARLH